MANGSDSSTKQITIAIIIALVSFAIGVVGNAAISPNPYLEDRKLIQASITDLKASMVTLRTEIEQLRWELRRSSHHNPAP